MKTLQDLINQQLGLSAWRNYDNVMERLRCTEKEEYKQIWFADETVAPVESPIFACKFAHKEGHEHILALANEDGKLAIHDTTNKEERYGKQVHHNAIFDLAWMFSQMKLVTASGDHTARLVDIGNGDIRVVQMFSGHTRSVKTVAIKQNDSSVFATGSRDGSVLVWDTRSYLRNDFISAPDRVILNAHFAKTTMTPTSKRKLPASMNPYISGANSVTGLAFQDDNTLVSCSAGDGTIKVWDLRKSYKNNKKEPYPKNVLSYSGSTTRCGFSNLIMDKDCIKLYANCLDHIIYCYNMSTCNPNPVMKYVGHQNKTFYVKSCLSNDGLYLLSGSSDQHAYIWNTHSSEPLVRLKGHTAEVTCVAWCQNTDQEIVTCSDDMRHKIWRIGPEILPDNWEVIGRGVAEPVKRIHDGESIRQIKKLKRCTSCSYADEKFCESCGAFPTTNKRLLGSNFCVSKSKRLCVEQDTKCLMRKKIKFTEEEIVETNHKKIKIGNNSQDLIIERSDINLDIQKCNLDTDEHLALKDNDLAESRLLKGSESINNISSNVCDILNKPNLPSGGTHHHTDTKLSSNSDDKLLMTRTPKHRRLESSPERCVLQSTANLPNFVIDGHAPHLNYSPEKRSDRDWLTKLRVEKSLIKEMEELASGSSPSKVTKFSSNSPRSKALKKQHKTGRCGSPQSPLLKFFRVTNNSIMKDTQSISKANVGQIH